MVVCFGFRRRDVVQGLQQPVMAAWRRSGEAGSLPPTRTKTVQRYELRDLTLRCLAQLRVKELSDLRASEVRTALLGTGVSVKRVNNVLSPLRQAFERWCKLAL
jgi:hypothetical protein